MCCDRCRRLKVRVRNVGIRNEIIVTVQVACRSFPITNNTRNRAVLQLTQIGSEFFVETHVDSAISINKSETLETQGRTGFTYNARMPIIENRSCHLSSRKINVSQYN